ncbi:hypothetical protein DXT98_13770 [Agrobacterium sp. ICMP 7243]|nr:hypothetical protein DXT98_13770 [Agrobacterium sp. ICMP 7243]
MSGGVRQASGRCELALRCVLLVREVRPVDVATIFCFPPIVMVLNSLVNNASVAGLIFGA